MPGHRPRRIGRLLLAALAATSLTALLVALAAITYVENERRRADVESLRQEIGLLRGDLAVQARRDTRMHRQLASVGRELDVLLLDTGARRLIWPVDGPILSPFGYRAGGMHEGIDVDSPPGTQVRAAATGTVASAGWYYGYGKLVVVDHGDGWETAYAHLTDVHVRAGTVVLRGAPVGTVGCTGDCSDAHLHFEVRHEGAPSDPLEALPARDPSHVAGLHWAG